MSVQGCSRLVTQPIAVDSDRLFAPDTSRYEDTVHTFAKPKVVIPVILWAHFHRSRPKTLREPRILRIISFAFFGFSTSPTRTGDDWPHSSHGCVHPEPVNCAITSSLKCLQQSKQKQRICGSNANLALYQANGTVIRRSTVLVDSPLSHCSHEIKCNGCAHFSSVRLGSLRHQFYIY